MRQGLSGRSVRTVLVGTIAGNAITLLGTPLLTRSFSTAEYGQFAAVLALASIMAPLASLRLEAAVPLVTNSADARRLIAVGLAWATTVGALGAGLLWALLPVDPRGTLFWQAPLMASAMGIFLLLNAYAVRDARFRAVATRTILVAIATLVTQLSLSGQNMGSSALILGWIVGQLVGASTLAADLHRRTRRDSSAPSRLTQLLYYYRAYPFLFSPSGVLNSAGVYLPVLLFVRFYGEDFAGQYGLMQRVLLGPIAVLGVAVGHVYVSQLGKVRRNRRSGALQLYLVTSGQLALVGVAVALTIGLSSPDLFPWLFGDAWSEAGELARLFTVAFVAQIVVSPISLTLALHGRGVMQLFWDSSRLIAVGAAIYIPHTNGVGAVGAAWCLALALACSYCLLWLMNLYAVRSSEARISMQDGGVS